MSYESDECKLLIDEAIHDYLHDDTETEMAVKDWFYDLRKQAAKANEYEAKNKELLEELQYLKKVNGDLVWQRDTDEEHEAKAKAFDRIRKILDELTSDEKTLKVAQSNNYVAGKVNAYENVEILMDDYKYIYKKYENGESE
ncbi:hypothetical protein [Jeotgalicoccus sp. FSL K6-3177]|uniref:hypothetical protein n=1 Tax=Jeotgalicoccus sp. FSL K6-3177 TaxID=2921494 RepID=UPI0030FDA6E3